ncbi:EAL domain-containing protein, partial [Spirochaetota bacterium]
MINIFTIVHSVCLIIYIYLAIYILIKNVNSLLNRFSFFMFLCFSLWSFSMIFMHNHHVGNDSIGFFHNFGSIGLISFPVFFLGIVIILTGKTKFIYNKILYLPISIFPLTILFTKWFTDSQAYYIKKSFGWHYTYPLSTWLFLFFIYLMAALILIIYLSARWIKANVIWTTKKNILLILTISISISFILFFLDFIFPNVSNLNIPGTGNISMLLCAGGFIISIVKYKFLRGASITETDNIISGMPDTILILDNSGKIIAVNKQAINLLSYTEKELIKSPVDLILGKSYKKFLHDIINEKEIRKNDITLLTKSGKEIPVCFSSSSMESELGDVTGKICIAGDMTELKKRQEELIAIKDSVIGSSLNAISLLDLDGNITYVNSSFVKMWGYDYDYDIIGEPFTSLWEEEDVAITILEELKELGSWIGELISKKKNGSQSYIHMSITYVYGYNSEPIGMTASFVDISMRKKIEIALQTSEEKYRTFYESALVGMMSTDEKTGLVLSSNNLCCELFGYSSKEEFVNTISINDTYSDSIAKEAIQNEVQIKGEMLNKEVQFKRKDGSTFWGEITSKLYRDKNKIDSVIVDVTKRKETEQQVYDLTFYDPLTGLPNREMFRNRVQIEVIKSERFAILCIGFDKFKSINDMYGAHVGDQLLKEISSLLKEIYFKKDMVARYEGDKFMVLLSDMGSEKREQTENNQNLTNSIDLVLQKTGNIFSETYIIDNININITTSIGVSFYPTDGKSPDQIIKNCESAMYLAKEQGGNASRYFDAGLNQKMMNRLQLEKELQFAVLNNEFIAHYQPKVDKNGNLTGMESLIRWDSPSRGLVPPYQFIPLTESNGMIVDIGYLILRKACEQNKKWQDMGYNPLRVAVNLSPYQFRQPDLIDKILEIINEIGLEPKWLELEITESGIIKNEEEAKRKLENFHKLGFSIAIDDFGTGYSSLSKLQDYPVDTLKIDKSFINKITFNTKTAAIVKYIINLAHDLDFKVVAEGIE